MYGIIGISLGIAALLGQKEAQVILFLWITWPILRRLFLALSRATESPRKKKEEKGNIEAIEAEVVDVWEDNSQRRSLPRTTRPELPDPDVVETEWRELPAPSAPRWKTAIAAALAIVGGLLFFIGFLGVLATLLR
jgi:multisubunit Na+/H+ antiporter MnhG subunit